MTSRFEIPRAGPADAVRFPAVTRDRLSNGINVWSISHDAAPTVTVLLVFKHGTAWDPPDRPGLAGLVADLIDEGAGGRNAIELSESFAKLGSHLEIDVGPDSTTIGFLALSRQLEPALALLGDVVIRPHLLPDDLQRVRELRLSRLRQLSRLPGAVADRVLLSAVFGSHPYGHGAVGTTASLQAVTLDEARQFWTQSFVPADATLIVVGDVLPDTASAAARLVLGDWRGSTSHRDVPCGGTVPRHEVLLIDRPGTPQAELRVGHPGPPRNVDGYHTLVTLNALLGGQFTSRINKKLREAMGVTYGARTTFDFRRSGGSFTCDTSVDQAATLPAITEILGEFEAVRTPNAILPDELARARALLTRGYVRNFETAGQLARAAAQLVVYGLDFETYDRFVPGVDAVTDADILAAATTHIHPDAATIVVVGDADRCRTQLETIGRPIVATEPEF